MNYRSVPTSLQNGRFTYLRRNSGNGYAVAKPQAQSNSWCSTENSSNNAWNVNPNNGNVNNNNKYNSNVVRPVAALCIPASFLDSVQYAYEDCQKGKRSSTQCVEYYSDAAEDIPRLAQELWSGTYRPGVSTCFLVSYPKWREVFAAHFRDRIVHHWLIFFLNPLFERRFQEQGNVSCNCRKGFGTNFAVKQATEGIKRVSANYRKPAWVFRGDMVGFFMSIDQNVMWQLMEPFIEQNYHGPYKDIILRVSKIIVFHRPEKLCVLNSNPESWTNLTSNKSLFRTPEGRGMPIGNLTTQIFANFYMSFFDEFVAKTFSGKNYYYTRFVDDFLIVCDDKGFLKRSIPVLRNYLENTLHIHLHKDKHYFQPVTHGIAFIGSYIKNNRTYLSNRTIARFTERVHGFNRMLETKENITAADLQRIQTVINSYLGFCKYHRTYSIRKRILLGFGHSFYKYFYIKGHYECVKLKEKYKPLKFEL